MLFEWRNEYETHIPEIDAQHRELVRLGSEIESLLLSGQTDLYDDLLDLISALKAYTVYHFASEEHLLETQNYPDFEEHQKEHERFISQLDDIDLAQLDHDQRKAANQLIRFISKWIFSHILGADAAYKLYFQETGLVNHIA